MSSKLKALDLSGAVVGTTGMIDFTNFVKFQANNMREKAHLWLFNESSDGIDVLFKNSNNSHFLPAGGWGTFEIEPNDSQVQITVTYVIPTPPVSLVQGIYYMPGEKVPQNFTLGNSAIGGGTTTVGSTLTNETATVGTEIIDIGTVANQKLLDIFNDHFLWKVEQAGVAHQVLKGQTAGNPLQIGQAGDIAEFLGQLLVDQIPTATATPPTGTGSVSIYEITIGPLKIVGVVTTSLQNTSASQFTLALPTAFTKGAAIICENITNTELMSGVTAQSLQVLTTPVAGGPSTISNQTVLFAYNLASIALPFDSLRFQANNATVHNNNVMVLIGV